ncbi:MAG TPA: RNA-directed DNA polymerase [Chlorobaculum parvum]|uniref:RNA-directed DNA polymerase n=1 Tax=Chlorobaculum parvum TaxID=274539 RepID=A0A7C5DH06_9CHLB|nr:RNA-directed DNA polymerase [Chlorobaculum parvum]
MQTERFNSVRKKALDAVFEKRNIINIWRKVVKKQLRDLDLLDLFDHFDFNYNIEDRAQSIRTEVLNGTYKASQPLIYRIEKKLGVCRHLVVPQPVDALILQVLVESIGDNVLKKQPSGKAFFSRDRHSVKKPHEFSSTDYSWKGQWKELQKQIYKFNESFELIVVTDLSNYYDSIDIRELKKVFTSYSQVDEVIIDLLFRTIEEISWKPDYMPYSKRGLPTTNVEAIRLLAHCFLFEIDEVLKQRTNDNFTRWMDDIVIGVESRKKAVDILSSVSDMLKSRGLALTLAKTNVYSDKMGYVHFQIEENRMLDDLSKRYAKVSPPKTELTSLIKIFKKHLQDSSPKYWDKVSKRYISFFGRHGSNELLPLVKKIYIEHPVLRDNLIVYLTSVGFTTKTAAIVLDIIKNLDLFDDISLFQLSNLVTLWQVPTDTESKKFLLAFENEVVEISKRRRLPSDFYSLLWFKTKYAHPDELLKFIVQFQNLWQSDSFLRRQVTAALARLLYLQNSRVQEILGIQFSSGNLSTITLANQLRSAMFEKELNPKISLYLFNPNFKKPFSVQRFLVLCSFLNSDDFRSRPYVKEKVLSTIKDPYYLKWLELQYNIVVV